MKNKSVQLIKQNKNILILALAVGLILLLPLIAMQFSASVDWSGMDFAVAGGLLFGTGLAYELVARRVDHHAYRAAVGLTLVTALLLVWLNLAVGIIGSEDNPANSMYLGVLAVLALGALLTRLRPGGMAGVLYATAGAQAAVTVIALFVEQFQEAYELLALNGFFVGLWVAAGVLFHRAHSMRNHRLM